MTHQAIARGMLAFLCAMQGLATLAIDFNRTHATNPDWTGHARFHLVWQDISCVLLSAIEVGLIYWKGPGPEQRFYLAALLASIPMLAFLLAFLGRSLYRGTLSDVNGIQPVRLWISNKTCKVDLNLLAELTSLPILVMIVVFFRR